MSESDTASVECPLCGEAFDPSAAGGWCTNSECGEWQYESDVTPDHQTATESEGSNDELGADTDGDDPLDEVDGDDAEEPAAWLDESTGGSEDDATDEGDATDDAADGADGEGAGESMTEPDAAPAGDGPAAMADEAAGDTADEAEAGDAAAEDDETFDCPGCGSALEALVNFCPDCGEDVSGLPGDAAGDELDECPDCGTDVESSDSFCAGCGADLDAYRSGGPTDASGGEGTGDAAPESLALTAHGKSVVVGDGDVVGREIRSLLTDAGRPEDEAVRVHREHVRFVREADQFYVVALGQNPTRVGGTSLAQGERKAVAPGDELELSNVVTLDVEAA
jgi:rubrerythrin